MARSDTTTLNLRVSPRFVGELEDATSRMEVSKSDFNRLAVREKIAPQLCVAAESGITNQPDLIPADIAPGFFLKPPRAQRRARIMH